MNKKGFTLLELLIVIAILAILASVTFVALNPAELLKKSRDTQRLADLASMRTAINYYIANTSSPILGDSSSAGCTDESTDYTYAAPASVAYTGTTNKGNNTASTYQQIGTSGWLTVRLDHLTGGSPLAKWPIDPSQTAYDADPSRYYAYLCHDGNVTFTVFANMESATYSSGGSGDVESRDGGNISSIYEVGTAFLASTTSAAFYPGTGT